MKPKRVIIYPIPLASIGLISASSIFLFAMARVSINPIRSFPPLYPVLFICSSVLLYQLLSWYELTDDGITRRRLYFIKTTYAWPSLHKFCVIPWKGTTDFLLFFNGFENKLSISSASTNIKQLRYFINTFANKPDLLYNGQGKEWLSRTAA